MSTIVTMSQTVGELINGSVYRVRSRNAVAYVAASQATASALRKNDSAIVGKRG